MARLDRLAGAKPVAQMAAIIGREFSYPLLLAVASLSEAELRGALKQLGDAELIFQRGDSHRAHYTFKHALIQEAAYQSLLKASRRVHHRRVAEAMERQFPETVETQPELLAYHCTEAGLAVPAIVYWRKAGQRAAKRAAIIEAIDHLHRGLTLLKTLPDRAAYVEEELAPPASAWSGPDGDREQERARCIGSLWSRAPTRARRRQGSGIVRDCLGIMVDREHPWKPGSRAQLYCGAIQHCAESKTIRVTCFRRITAPGQRIRRSATSRPRMSTSRRASRSIAKRGTAITLFSTAATTPRFAATSGMRSCCRFSANPTARWSSLTLDWH